MSEAQDPFDAIGSDAGYQRPRLRADLRIVYENQGTGTARIRVADPVSGKQFTFNEQEHFLCQTADGTADLRAIHASHREHFGKEMAPRDVAGFFRRLQILGLLAPAAAPPVPVPPVPVPSVPVSSVPVPADTPAPAPAPASAGRGVLARGIGTRAMASRRRMTGAAEGLVSQAEDPAPIAARNEAGPKSGPMSGTETGNATGNATGPESGPESGPATGNETTGGAGDKSRNNVPEPAKVVAPVAAAGMASALGRRSARFVRPIKSDRTPVATPDQVPDRAPETTQDPAPESTSDLVADKLTDQEATQLATADLQAADLAAAVHAARPELPSDAGTAPVDPLDIIAGNLAGSVAERRPGTFEDDDDPFAGMGGGLGGAMGGGMAGVMGGGRFGGAGMGGGMAGGANRERIMAALAARKGGMGGGMALAGGLGAAGMGAAGMAPGGNAGAMGAPAVEQRPASLTLLNPGLLLRILYVVFYPAKLILWVILPAVVLAGVTALQNWGALATDQAAFLADYATVTIMLIGVFTVNLASRLAQGVAIVAHGGKVNALGLMLVFGFVPRFFIDLSAIPGLDRRGQLWAHAAPLLARLGLFALGVMIWAITRDSGTWLSQISLAVGQFGLAMFLFSALPLVPGDGQRWIATYMNEPRLLQKAAAALRHVLTGKPLPPIIEKGDLWPLVMFAVGTILTVTAVALGMMVVAALMLEAEFGGTGVSLFLGMVAAFLIWLVTLRASIGRRAGRMRMQAGAAGAGAGVGAVPAGAGGPMLGRMVDPSPNPGLLAQSAVAADTVAGSAKVVWGVIVIGLLAVAFLPYNYESGGLVEIMPAARAQAVARSDGEILEIMVTEGDIVSRGQIVAQLSSWNQEREVSVTQTMLQGAEAALAGLLAGPKSEQVELARRQLDSAQASVTFSAAEAERARTLVTSGVVSQQTLEEANSVYAADLANLEVARANLELVQSGATPEQIRVAQAEVDRLTLELAFRRDDLERTRIAAPMDGRVVTANLQLRHGSFLRIGETLLEIEDAATVNAVIAVPESDIALIGLGAVVRLKAWGQSDSEIDGVVRAVAPAADDEGYGRVVRVDAVFPNPDGVLRSGMTGYAKIESQQMRVWEAYLRSIRRFFQIEVWSWIP